MICMLGDILYRNESVEQNLNIPGPQRVSMYIADFSLVK